MYRPRFRKNQHGVPIISKTDINFIAERFVSEFDPDSLTRPQPFDIELFLENDLNLTLDFQYLSHNGIYLGMTVFNDTSKLPVYIPEYNIADYIEVSHGTVIIDNSLLEDSQTRRCRFTVGHECGHWIFHKDYFGYDPNQMTLFEINTPFIQCREVNSDYKDVSSEGWDDFRWMEWQADKFSSSILMPESAVKLLAESCQTFSDCDKIRKTADTFDVSIKAAYYRLCDLNICRANDCAGADLRQLSLLQR